jgi:hypothetical protein
MEEYIRVENSYVETAMYFAMEFPGAAFAIAALSQQEDGFDLRKGQTLLRSDLAAIIRGNLRGDLDCVLETTNGECQLAFGYDLYMYVAATAPCECAVHGAQRAGLYVESDVPLVQWDQE